MIAGAKMIKLFPAQMWTPDTFKALRAVGMFGDVDLLPSGTTACNRHQTAPATASARWCFHGLCMIRLIRAWWRTRRHFPRQRVHVAGRWRGVRWHGLVSGRR